MFIDMKKIYEKFQSFNEKDWEEVDKAMSSIIAKREETEK